MGSAGGFDPKRTAHLPTFEARFATTGDFNRDGHVDIAIANASRGGDFQASSFVYWGGTQGFSAARRSELPTLGATGVAAGDLNQDGFADLVFSNANDGRTHDVPSYIYWGSAEGFAPYLRADVQTFGAASVNVADLDADGKLGFCWSSTSTQANRRGMSTRPSSGATAHQLLLLGFDGPFPGLGSYDTTVTDSMTTASSFVF